MVLGTGERGQDTVFVLNGDDPPGAITQADIAAAVEVVRGVGPRKQRVPDPPECYA